MKRLFWVFCFALLALSGCSKSDGGDVEGGGAQDAVNDHFKIEIGDLTASCAKVSVTSQRGDKTFYFDVLEAAILEAYDSLDDIAAVWVKNIYGMIDEYREEYDELYEFADFLSTGHDSYYYPCIFSPETEYIVIAFDVNADGEVGEHITTKRFKTTEVKPSNNTFKISVNEGIATIDASVKDEFYLFDIFSAESLKGWSEQQIIALLIYNAIDFGIDDFVMGRGVDEIDYNYYLVDGTTYSACCVGYDGGATTSLTRYDFVYKNDGSSSDLESDFYPGVSNLSNNVEMQGDRLEVIYYGDIYASGGDIYEFRSVNESGTVEFSVEVCVDAERDSFDGTYHTASELGLPNSMMQGYQLNEYIFYGSWYFNRETDENSAAVDGVTTIAVNGENIRLTTEWSDANGKRVKGLYSGPYTFTDNSVAVQSLSHANPLVTRYFKGSPIYPNKRASTTTLPHKSAERHTRRAMKVSLAE